MLIYKTNGKSYEPEITYIRDGGSHYGGGGSIWAVDQIRHMKQDLDEIAKNTVANSVKLVNKLCKQSNLYTPTLKSLAYFSDIEDIVSERRREEVLFPTKNPVMFGAMVYLETEKLLGGVEAEISYAKPSSFIGLEFGSRSVVNKSKLQIDYDHPYATRYADKYEQVILDIENICSKINFYMDWITEGDMNNPSEDLDEVVRGVLDNYHRIIKDNVLIGLTKPAIEDSWVNQTSASNKELSEMLLKIYNYAESRGLEYSEEYPSFNSALAEVAMQEELHEFDSNLDYTLYSSIFSEIKYNTIKNSSGREYNLCYVIPTMVYAKALLEDLEGFYSYLNSNTELQDYYECKLILERQFAL